MKHKYSITLTSLCILLCFAFIGETVNAQPALNLKRLTNNWPTIELYFDVICNGTQVFSVSERDFQLLEDGKSIDEFTLWCPDPGQRCAISVSLVFDASGSMGGAGNGGAKAAGHGFINLMDGIQDEAAIIWFSSSVNIELSMTTNLMSLHNAVDALPASGATAVWDGIYAGVSELVSRGSNPCRGVIAMTDGGDNSSTRTPAEIIALALSNRLRVFTVGLGNGVQDAQLKAIADQTGGTYYKVASPDQLPTVYAEIFDLLHKQFLECVITYEANCPDGTSRFVELELPNFCGGSDSDIGSFQAPDEPGSFQALDIIVKDSTVIGGGDVEVPFYLNGVPAGSHTFGPTEVEIIYDPQCMQFTGLQAPAGTVFEGTQFIIIENSPGTVEVRMDDEIALDSDGILFMATFDVFDPVDSLTCQVGLHPFNWAIEKGCFRYVPLKGTFEVIPSPRPTITLSNGRILCTGDSTTLTAADSLSEYNWSNGDSTRSIVVTTSGTYSYTAMNIHGTLVQSNEVDVVVIPVPNPAINAFPALTACTGDTIKLTPSQNFASYKWSNGPTTRINAVTQSGTYRVVVVTPEGCVGQSESVTVTFNDPSNFTIVGNSTPCKGSTQKYTIDRSDLESFQWSVTGGTIIGDSDKDEVTIQWHDSYLTGMITLQAEKDQCVGSASLQVLSQPEKPVISVTGDTVMCAGETTRLKAPDGYRSYLWSHGPTSQTVLVDQAGTYSVTVSDGDDCISVSDEVTITVYPPPSKPTISRAGDDLVSTPAVSYIWKIDGTSIPGATGQTYTPTQSGLFSVTVTDSNGCTATSDQIDVAVGVEALPEYIELFEMYPIPVSSVITLGVVSKSAVRSIKISNSAGQMVQELSIQASNRNFTRKIDLTHRQPGVYFLSLVTDSGTLLRKFIVK